MDMVVADGANQREDLTRHPMAVALASALASVLLAGLLGAPGWLVVGMTSLRTDVALLASEMKAGQERLSTEIGGIRQEVASTRQGIANLKALVSSQPPTE